MHYSMHDNYFTDTKYSLFSHFSALEAGVNSGTATLLARVTTGEGLGLNQPPTTGDGYRLKSYALTE